METPLIDLNQLPCDEEIEEARGDIPLFIHSHSTNSIVLDMGRDDEARYRYWDLNFETVHDFDEDDVQTQKENNSTHAHDSGMLVYCKLSLQLDVLTLKLCGARQRRLVLSDEQRLQVYQALLEKSHGGKLKRQTTTEVSNLFAVPIRTVQRIWKLGKNNGGDVKSKKKKRCGHPKLQVDITRLTEIPLTQRTTLASLSEALGVSNTVLYTLIKEGLIRRHSNTLKPHLKDGHKRARLQFCLSMLDQTCMPNEPKFVGMYSVVHIDEKWFYMTKKKEKYYLHSMEADPLRTCQSKNYIGKVMFLVAMARPRYDCDGNETFSGKIGVFPLITKEPAIRRSRNRDAGTLVTKSIPSITREVIRSFLIEKVVPAIKATWPIEDMGGTIFIQQDNARTHIDPNDREFRRVASQDGFDIRLMCQPANSPDLNILDLGFFNAIQSLQQKKRSKTVDELIDAVEKSFMEYPTIKIERTWITLQLCMIEIMKIEGSNRYKIPHMNKARMERLGTLPKQIVCDRSLIENVTNQLRTMQ
ncbi:uncharacterized protein LOC141589912 [Silene latifolia]|uniref:uncharacterized protein LOC141589912 n=1 Tax=Silene latifolia TaxID=37657 RepID=UPI003D7765FF